MAISSSLLNPANSAPRAPNDLRPTEVAISHVQLRDLLICPSKTGVVNYVQNNAIVEHNLNSSAPPRPLVNLDFTPNTLASLPIPYSSNTLLAAGGQDAQIHLSLHRPSPYSPHASRCLSKWQDSVLGSINNSVLLTSLSLTRSNESSTLPRLGISNNDRSFRIYDVGFRPDASVAGIQETGSIQFNVPVNYSTISPDGRTLLSVGDSATVHLHHITGGRRVTFNPVTTLNIPPPKVPTYYSSSHIIASFSAAFSANGSKFAVASQEGVVAVWDVRSSKPMQVFYTNKTFPTEGRNPRDGDSDDGWLSDDPHDWTSNFSRAPGWSARTVKFGGSTFEGAHGKEVMVFSEHTSLVHVVDARTFETEEIIHMPDVPVIPRPIPQPTPSSRQSSTSRYSSPPIDIPTVSRISTLSNNSSRSNIQALEDTFRVSPWRSGMSHISSRTLRDWGRDAEDDIVVIPPMGDRQVESDLRALLNNRHSSSYRYNEDGSGTMDVDELESDCVTVSSRAPSRSTSPSPSGNLPNQPSPGNNASSMRRQDSIESGSSETMSSSSSTALTVNNSSGVDIAGVCFDPTGSSIYVASSNAIGTWRIHGAEKRWWVDDRWM